MNKPTKTPFQRRAARVAYALFFSGLLMAGTGQYALHNSAIAAIGIILVVISLVAAFIAYPEMIG